MQNSRSRLMLLVDIALPINPIPANSAFDLVPVDVDLGTLPLSDFMR